ncbi:MAG: DAK2 domain-containing protein [Pseudonocardia sp.]
MCRQTLDAALLRGWASAATLALERHCAEIDRINVFPVPDRDTGTNLLLTMRAATDAGRRGLREGNGEDLGPAPVAVALARGALLGARGNSGVILSQVLRGVADAVTDASGVCGGAVFTDGLHRADRLATAALSRPREGTMLSVLRAGAAAARRQQGGLPESRLPDVTDVADRLEDVAVAAADGAAAALRATTAQLPELARAGVVDAGGLGLFVVLDALACLVSGRAPATSAPASGGRVTAPVRDREVLTAEREGGSAEFDYEVMYLLDGTDADRVEVLRGELATVGDCVAIVGDGAGLWNVHVHCADIGAALEAGLEAGRPHRVTVIRFADQVAGTVSGEPGGRFVRARAVLMVVGGAELAELARAEGADVLRRPDDRPVDEAELVAALVGTRARHVVLLPDDAGLTPAAERAASTARRDGQEVLVVPTSSVLQGLSALAVHDAARRAGDDVVAMAEAAAGTRTAGLLVAETEALTWAGRCEPGDVLGISDGEVVLIAPDLAVGALWLAHRMLTAGGELVTALLGAGIDDELGEGLAIDLRRTHPEVDVMVYRGGQTDYPLVLGVE